jgi:nucleolar protein 15
MVNKHTKRKRAKDDEKKKLEEEEFLKLPDDGTPSNVIYLGHLPHGFYEDQMAGFFSQFGKVDLVRVSRSKKSGRSKGYAFVRFDKASVAQTVAEVMNGYHLFDKVLVSHVIPKSKVHPSMFKGANKKFKPVPWNFIAKKQHNRERTEEERSKAITRLGKKQAKLKEKLKTLGIEYDFKGYADVEKFEDSSSGSVSKKRKTTGSTKKKKKTSTKKRRVSS